ncbi:MAG: S1C family serine protease, partial [Cyclobacteriaceae bacterium]|nr:S1C family serine protease [Cyclobacteriaceae bacterium]
MTNRSLFFAMILSSLIGGVVAIGGYALLLDEKQAPVLPVSQSNPAAFTNYVVDTATSIVPEGLNFVHAANSATASVVHIKTTYSGIREGVTSPMDEFLREYFGDTPGRQRGPSQGAGSGVIVSPNGYIVTNNHVVDDATEIEVLLNDNRSFKADVIGLDPTTDLAVLKIKADNLPSMKWGNSEQLQLGEWVLAVGNPFEFRSTVTAGIVSAKARNIGILARQNDNLQIESFIQT